jgi:hypothetical protein
MGEATMPNDSSINDPKRIWQNQPTEACTMTLEAMRTKVKELHAKTRKQLLGNLAVLLVVVALYGFGTQRFPSLKLLLALPIAWSLAGVYFLNRGMWSGTTPEDAALSTGLQSYRREVARRRDLFNRILLWSFGPVLLAIGTFLVALARVSDRAIFPNAMPFMTLVVVWIAAYFVIRMREQRELQREIDELNEIERQSSR